VTGDARVPDKTPVGAGHTAERGATCAVRPAERGFTLIELMVALMIFGLIAGAGVAILAFSVRAQGATAARLDDAAALARAGSLLSADLGQALNRPTRDEGGTLLPAFSGDGVSMRFVRGGWSNLDSAPRPSVQKVGWLADGGALRRLAYPMLDGAAARPSAPVLSGVRAVSLRYRYRGAWSDRWDGTAAPLPDAVEMVVVRRDGVALRQMFLTGTGYVPTPN